MNFKHGDARKGQVTRLHKIWRGMLKRCTPGNANTAGYAARGISVCEEWREFEPFREWALQNGYSPSLTIDRTDNDGPYSAENCRWSDRKAQARNRRSSRYLTFDNRRQVKAAWAEELGLCVSTITTRLNRGWSVERTLSERPNPAISGRPRQELRPA